MSYDPSLATIELLAETYPQCFSVFEKRRRPLKIGIRDDLIAALAGAITPKEAALALAIYCGNWCYLKACREGAPRIDLNGNVVGTVDADAANNAKQRLEQQRNRRKRQLDAIAQAEAEAERKARNAGRVGMADLRAAALARKLSPVAA
jgi:ProP effector